ncbi:hypothetical protein [Sorangium sp. So ce1000]|uniref:hypothetical protein n=1 Tax=Sorangium sp. So ce1000 TaxID=3133325 RepID=UPI003F5DD3AE
MLDALGLVGVVDVHRAEALAARLRERIKAAPPTVACLSPSEVLREVRLASAP